MSVSNPRLFTFSAGPSGAWTIIRQTCIVGDPLAPAARLEVTPSGATAPNDAAWALQGVTSNVRYTLASEKVELVTVQEAIGRPHATRAALIPIRKSAAWWDLSQDERRKIFEDASQHNRIGLKYLPAIARRLHHCRDLAAASPFDFLTWFDYAPEHTALFEDLVGQLRQTEEWKYVDREIDIRVEGREA